MAANDWAAVAEITPVLTLGIVGGWSRPLAEMSVYLKPSEIIIAGWKRVSEMPVYLKPSEIIIAGWKRVSEMPLELLPPIMCLTDADCPEGYVCKNGVCVKKGGEFPWGWFAIGGTAAIAAILIVSAQQKQKRK